MGISPLSWIERDGNGEPGGRSNSRALKLDFDRRLVLQFRGSLVTSDAGLFAYRELDDAVGLTAMAGETLADARAGKNNRHALVGLLRQSAQYLESLALCDSPIRKLVKPDVADGSDSENSSR